VERDLGVKPGSRRGKQIDKTTCLATINKSTNLQIFSISKSAN
jgi:hypothetical protein